MATHGKSSSYLEREGSAGYSCQCRSLYLQTTGTRLSEDTQDGSAEVENWLPSKIIDLKYLLILTTVLIPVLVFSQDSLSVSNADTTQKAIIFNESVETDSTQMELGDDTTSVIEQSAEPDLQENQLSADTTAVIDEPAEPDPTQNQIIAHTTLGILPLESPEYSQIEMFAVADYVQKEAEATGRFSTVTMLFADVMLDTLKELGEGCADLDCAYDVAMTVSLAGALRHYMMPEVTPPVPALGLQAVMIGVAYYVSLKGKED